MPEFVCGRSGSAQMGTMDAEALSATRGQTGHTSEVRPRAVMRAYLRDRHTPWVSLCGVLGYKEDGLSKEKSPDQVKLYYLPLSTLRSAPAS